MGAQPHFASGLKSMRGQRRPNGRQATLVVPSYEVENFSLVGWELADEPRCGIARVKRAVSLTAACTRRENGERDGPA
jgi:hypothetical protein